MWEVVVEVDIGGGGKEGELKDVNLKEFLIFLK